MTVRARVTSGRGDSCELVPNFLAEKENHTLGQLDLVYTDISKEAQRKPESWKWYELQVYQGSKIHSSKSLLLPEDFLFFRFF